jgi:Ca2+/Na+ antiporter
MDENFKNFFLKNRSYFISMLSFVYIILLGVLAKIFFIYREYFWYILALYLFLFLLLIYFLSKNKKLKEYYKEALNDDKIMRDELKEKKKKNGDKLDYFIKIISILIIIVFILYFLIKLY